MQFTRITGLSIIDLCDMPCLLDRVRITAQLIRVPIERHIWAQSFEGDLRDTLVLQSSVARAIAAQIRATVSEQEQATLQNSKPVNPVLAKAFDTKIPNTGLSEVETISADDMSTGNGGKVQPDSA